MKTSLPHPSWDGSPGPSVTVVFPLTAKVHETFVMDSSIPFHEGGLTGQETRPTMLRRFTSPSLTAEGQFEFVVLCSIRCIINRDGQSGVGVRQGHGASPANGSHLGGIDVDVLG